jgi:hypothetical protein
MKSLFTTTIAVLIVAISIGQCDMNGVLSVFGSTGDQTGHAVVESTDGGYFFLGVTSNLGNKIMVVKTDENLVKLWTKTYGSASVLDGQAIVATSDGMGGCVFAGYELNSYRSAVCLRIDANGNLIWSKKLPAYDNETPRSIFRADNGLFVLCVTTNSFGSGYADALVHVFDMNGYEIWTKTIGNGGNDHFYAGFQNLAGNYVLAGHSDYSMSGRQSWIVELTPNGEVLSDILFNDGANSYISDLCQDANGFYYLTGCQLNSGTGDSWIAKLDSNYEIVWSKVISTTGNDRGLSVHLNNEGEVVFTSVSDGLGSLSSFLITRLESTAGDFVSNSLIDYVNNETTHILAKNAFLRSDNRIVVYGGTSSFGNGSENIMCLTDPCLMNDCTKEENIQLINLNLVKSNALHNSLPLNNFFDISLPIQVLNITNIENSEMCVYKGVSELQMGPEIIIYPNPTSGLLTLNVELSGLKNYQIFGMDGKLVKSGSFTSLITELDVQELSSGMYIFQIIGEKEMHRSRFEKI